MTQLYLEEHPAEAFIVSKKEIASGVTVTVLGKPVNWSSNHLVGDITEPRGDARILYEMQSRLLTNLGITKSVFTPRMKNARGRFVQFCPVTVFGDPYKVKGNITFHKSSFHIDAFNLPKGRTALLPTADCPTIVFRCRTTGELAIAHASRDSLLHWTDTERPRSVIDNVVDYYLEKELRVWDIDVWVFCGIEAEAFPHPTTHKKFGEKNKKLLNYLKKRGWQRCITGDWDRGCLSLTELIGFQCADRGIPCGNRFYLDTETHGTHGNPNLWSHTAGDTARNGILIEHKRT